MIDTPENADALAFLRAGLTDAEQKWPRFRAELREIGDVPIGELRTHPELVELVQSLAPADAKILMGAVVLVDDRQRIYAIGMGTHTLVFPGLKGDSGSVQPADTPIPPSKGGGWHVMPAPWLRINAFSPEVSQENLRARLKLVRRGAE